MDCPKITKVLLPENTDGGQKIVCKIDSKHCQVGNDNKAYFVYNDGFRRGAEHLPNSETIDLGEIAMPNGSENVKQFDVKAEVVQVIARDDSKIELQSSEGSTIQVGNKTVLRLFQDETSIKEPKYLQSERKWKRKARKKRPTTKAKQSYNIHYQPSDESLSLYKKFFEEVSAVLHPLRDDGKWDLFNDKLNEFRSKYGSNATWDILLTLEQAQQMCYHSCESNIAEAERILSKAIKEMPKRLANIDPSIKQLCEGRAYCYLASVYRHHKLLGKANQCLDEAQKRLEPLKTEFLYDNAIVYYEKASFLLEFDKLGSNPEEIRVCLDNCSQLCDEINKERKWEFVKKGHFAKLKKAMLLLNCSTKTGRKRRISDEDLDEAKKCLEELENENSEQKEVPISEQLQCLLAKSDKAFRCSRFNEAKDRIEEAITLANTNGFDENPALKRLQDIETMLQKNVTSPQQRNILDVKDVLSEFQSGSGDADMSNTAEDTD